ncbi:hypothetical protein HK098_005623 [Nowakowskiella sp. JEL0407]|nr:hypothetical protein HK098_005623 [Nowakowskiella sp. JEL0407]
MSVSRRGSYKKLGVPAAFSTLAVSTSPIVFENDSLPITSSCTHDSTHALSLHDELIPFQDDELLLSDLTDKRSDSHEPESLLATTLSQFLKARPRKTILKSARSGDAALKDLNNINTFDVIISVKFNNSLATSSSHPPFSPTASISSISTLEELESSFSGFEILTEKEVPEPMVFVAHRVYLERCAFFRSCANLSFNEGNSNIVSVTLPVKAADFAPFLQYIYTGVIDLELVEIPNLMSTFIVADYLMLNEVVKKCRDVFRWSYPQIIQSHSFSSNHITCLQLKSLMSNDLISTFPGSTKDKIELILLFAQTNRMESLTHIQEFVNEELLSLKGKLDAVDFKLLRQDYDEAINKFVTPVTMLQLWSARTF